MRHILVLLAITFFYSCKQDQPDKPAVAPQEVVIGMTKSPDRINPIIYPTSLAREVYQYIFLPLADYNPETYDLEPILIESLPESTILEEGPYAGKASFKMRIIDDAIWENGSPITGKDYAFTIKAIKQNDISPRTTTTVRTPKFDNINADVKRTSEWSAMTVMPALLILAESWQG